ncbi:MAG: NAD-binding protein [Mycobacteriaceae bacterium]|nr:NAD-binding protein [Mycobacteriaceae bacterium]
MSDDSKRLWNNRDDIHDHIIVSGDDALLTTIVTELNNVGAHVVKLASAGISDTQADLVQAGIAYAAAVVCVGNDDAANLEIALLARKANPAVRVVARLANDVLRQAVAAENGPGAIFDVAELAAPAVVEACLAQAVHPFEVAGITFLVSGSQVPRDATLRELYGDLAPVAVIHGEHSPSAGTVVACPSRDLPVHAGDWTAIIGTADELTARGVKVPRPTRTPTRRPPWRRMLDAARIFRDEINPMFYPVVSAVIVLLISSTILLRFNYQRPAGMSWIDAVYFSTETITTTGFGDFSFVGQSTALRLYATMMMLGGVTITALVVSFIADLLLSRRFVGSADRRRMHHLRNHIIIVGLSALGIRVVSDLTKAGYDVAVIERDENNRYLESAAELDVPVIFRDATLHQTLETARIDHARAVAVLTRDDMINIEIGIVLDEMLSSPALPQPDRPEIPLVLRVYDRPLGFAVAQRFGFKNVRSSVELAAPWFVGAALGLQVVGTFSIGQSSFVIGEMHVQTGSPLDGRHLRDLSAQIRVIVITRQDTQIQLYPSREARLQAGDTVYLVGPYRELLATLHQAQPMPF